MGENRRASVGNDLLHVTAEHGKITLKVISKIGEALHTGKQEDKEKKEELRELLVEHFEGVIFSNLSCPALQNHPDDVAGIIKTAWAADRDKFSACLNHLHCAQLSTPESFGLKEVRSATKRRKAFKPKPGKVRCLFVLISTVGKMMGDNLMLQMSDGSWTALSEILVVVLGSVADYLPVVIISAIEDPLEPSQSGVERGHVHLQLEGHALVTWALQPMHPLWIEEDGSVLVQVLSDIMAGAGDASTIQEMFGRVVGVLEWYNSSREKLLKERSTWSSIGVQEEGEEGEEEGGERESMIEEGEGGEGGESKSGGAGEGERGERERGESGEGDREAGRAGQARKGIPSLSLSSVGTGPAESSERSWRSERTYRPKDYEKGMLWAFYGTCAGPNQLPVRFQLGRVSQPSFSPNGNTLVDNDGALIWHKQWQSFSVHTHQVKVTIVSQTPGATVFYTTDGTDPEPEAGTTRRYKKPVLIDYYGDGSKEFVVKAIARKEGLPDSRISASDIYRIQGQVKPVTFKDVRVDDSVLLSMSCMTPGAVIYYDDTGGIPTLSSRLYSEPIRLHSKIVKAFATARGQTDSAVATFELRDQVQLPAVEMTGVKALTSSLEDAEEPAENALRISTGSREDLFVHDYTQKNLLAGGGGAREGGKGKKKASKRYEVFLDEATVQASSGSSEAPGFRMYYTRDRTKPSISSKRYTGPIHITTPGTHFVTFMAMAHLMADSEVVEVSLTVQNRVATPTIAPHPDTYKIETTVQCDCHTDGASLFLTLDGSDPLPPSPATISYSAPLHLNRRNPALFQPGAILASFSTSPFVPLDIRVRLFAVKRQHVDSFPAEAHYRLLEVVETPTAEPASALYSEFVDVELHSATDGAAILYTMDGSFPTPSSPVYAGPIRVHEVGWTTITARAVKEDMWDSAAFKIQYGVEAQVLAIGHGRDGRLGNGSERDSLKPVRVHGLLEHSVARAGCGRAHTVLLDSQGKVLTCGARLHGRLAHDHAAVLEPRLIKFQPGGPWKITQVAAGERHSILLASNGAVLTFGDGNCGQLGHGDWASCSHARIVDKVTSGRRADGKQSGTASLVKYVAAGAFHSLALSRDGLVWSWGRGGEGQLGNEERFSSCTPDRMAAKLVDGEEEGLYSKKVTSLAAGDWHSVMLLTDGTVYTCGRGIEGQLGYEDVTFMLMPGKIHALNHAHLPITQVAAGRAHTLMLDRDGRVWSCGSSERGQCGIGVGAPITVLPQVVLEGKGIAQIVAGPEYSIARAATGAVWVWGRGDWGQLGLGDTEDRGVPTKVDVLEGFKVKDISGGEKHMVVVISQEHCLLPPSVAAAQAAAAQAAAAESGMMRSKRSSGGDYDSLWREESDHDPSWRSRGRRRSSVAGSLFGSDAHVSSGNSRQRRSSISQNADADAISFRPRRASISQTVDSGFGHNQAS